mmetsp:Transcript_30293/g.64181  ORF Transcript_30293/g.64181 Transcript_30293/m.64181 type:complete len:393 (-) Transcript_30293:439-1617(-)
MSVVPQTVVSEEEARNSSVAPTTRVVSMQVSSASDGSLAKLPPVMSQAVSLPISGSMEESYGSTPPIAQNNTSLSAAETQISPGANNDPQPIKVNSSGQSASSGKKNEADSLSFQRGQESAATKCSAINISGRWTAAEHEEFLQGLKVYGREWKKVATHIKSGRSSAQIRSHAQKYFAKVSKHQQQLLALAEKRRTSFPDAMPSKSDASVLLHGQSMSQSFIDTMNSIMKNPPEVETRVFNTLTSLRERYKQLEDRLQQGSVDTPVESGEAFLCPATAALELEQKSLRNAAEARYEMKKHASQQEKKQPSTVTKTNDTSFACVSLTSMPSQGGFDSNDVIALSMLGGNLSRDREENKTLSTKQNKNSLKLFRERLQLIGHERPPKIRKVDEH